MKKEITCTVCPRGCTVTADVDGTQILSIEGYSCQRGLAFAESEITHPARLLTSTVRVSGAAEDLLPVRSRTAIPREKLMDCMAVIRQTAVKAPVAQHDVIVADICGTGVDIIASKSV